MAFNPEHPYFLSQKLTGDPLRLLLPNPDAPVHLDVGTGLGHFLEAMAQREPDANWLGLEYDGAILKRAVRRVRRAGLQNAALFIINARSFLLEAVEPESLAHIWLNFPDPWPKKKHANRRHAAPWMLGLLASRLQVGGELHLATDMPLYLSEMLTNMAAVEAMRPAKDTPWQRETLGIQTKYERKWAARQRPLFYADWRKEYATTIEAYPYLWQPAPDIRFNAPPAPGMLGTGRYRLKVFAPGARTPQQTNLVFIDREVGINTFGSINLEQGGLVCLKGIWTPWKIDLLADLV